MNSVSITRAAEKPNQLKCELKLPSSDLKASRLSAVHERIEAII